MKKLGLMIEKVIWFALTFSQLLYVLVAVMVQSGGEPTEMPLVLVVSTFGALAALHAIASLIIWWKLLSPRVQQARINVLEKSGGDLDTNLHSLKSRFFVPRIIALVLNEGICLYGFVPAFISHDPTVMYPFVLVGLGLNVLVFPRYPVFDRAVARTSEPGTSRP